MSTLGENLRRIRLSKGLSQQELSRKTGGAVSQALIAQLEMRKSSRSRYTIPLAEALGVSVGELMGVETSPPTCEPGPDTKGWIPLISWVQAGDFNGNVEDVEVEDWYPTPKPMSDKSFCLRVRGDSMFPRLVEGDIIYVDPKHAQDPGKIVVAYRGGETTVKQLVNADGEWFLHALNPDWPGKQYIPINDEVRIIGVVTGKYVPF